MIKNLSASSLLANIFNDHTPSTPKTDTKRVVQTTIRINQEVDFFTSYHSLRLGISKQDLLSLILQGVVNASTNLELSTFEIIFDRFKRIISQHKIPQIHTSFLISKVSSNSFSLGAISNIERFIDDFQPSTKKSVTEFFHLNPEWLSGGNTAPCSVPPIHSRDLSFEIIRKIKHSNKIEGFDNLERTILAVKGTDTTPSGMPSELILYKVNRWLLDKDCSFSTYQPLGLFQLLSREAEISINAVLKTAINDLNIYTSGIAVSNTIFNNLKSGTLLAEAVDIGFPTLFDINSIIKKGDDEDVNFVQNLIHC